MDRRDVITRIRSVEPILRAQGVRALFLFGSYGRDEAKPQSDIDVFIDAESEAFYELSNYMGAYGTLSDAFPEAEIGYATRAGLSKYIRQAVETEAVQVF